MCNSHRWIMLLLILGIGLVGSCKPASKDSDSKDAAKVPELMQQLQAEDATTRIDTARELMKIGPPAREAIPALIANLSDHRVVPRPYKTASPASQAARALAMIGPAAVDPLIAALTDSDPEARRHIVLALGYIGERRAMPVVVEQLKAPEPEVRVEAAAALGFIKDRRAVGPLVAALEDQYPQVVREAARALGELGDQSATDPLIGLLSSENSLLRVAAAQSLGKLKARRAAGPLAGLLTDVDSKVRIAAADALGEIGDRQSVGPLIDALNDQSNVVVLLAGEALAKITGQSYGTDREAWQSWQQHH